MCVCVCSRKRFRGNVDDMDTSNLVFTAVAEGLEYQPLHVYREVLPENAQAEFGEEFTKLDIGQEEPTRAKM